MSSMCPTDCPTGRNAASAESGAQSSEVDMLVRDYTSEVPKNKLVKTGDTSSTVTDGTSKSLLDAPMEFVKWANPGVFEQLVDWGMPASVSEEVGKYWAKCMSSLLEYRSMAWATVNTYTDKYQTLIATHCSEAWTYSKTCVSKWGCSAWTQTKDWTKSAWAWVESQTPENVKTWLESLPSVPTWDESHTAYCKSYWDGVSTKVEGWWTTAKEGYEKWSKQASEVVVKYSTWIWEHAEVAMNQAVVAGNELVEGAEKHFPKSAELSKEGIHKVHSFGKMTWDTISEKSESLKNKAACVSAHASTSDALAWSTVMMAYLTSTYESAAAQLNNTVPIYPARA